MNRTRRLTTAILIRLLRRDRQAECEMKTPAAAIGMKDHDVSPEALLHPHPRAAARDQCRREMPQRRDQSRIAVQNRGQRQRSVRGTILARRRRRGQKFALRQNVATGRGPLRKWRDPGTSHVQIRLPRDRRTRRGRHRRWRDREADLTRQPHRTNLDQHRHNMSQGLSRLRVSKDPRRRSMSQDQRRLRMRHHSMSRVLQWSHMLM